MNVAVDNGGGRRESDCSKGDGRRLAWVAFGVAGVTAVLFVIAVLFAGPQEGYVHLRWLGYPGLWGLLCAASVFVGFLAMAFGRFVGLVGTALSIGVIAAGVLLVYLVGPGDMGDQTIASPDGKRVLVIDVKSKMIDPYWVLWVQDARGIGAKYTCLGAVDGDYNNLDSARWASNDEIELRIDAEPVRMKLGGDVASVPSPIVGC